MASPPPSRGLTTTSLIYGGPHKNKHYRPGQYDLRHILQPSSDVFLRNKVQPNVRQWITPTEDYFIRFIDFINVVFSTTVAELFQWLGTWNLLAYYTQWGVEAGDSSDLSRSSGSGSGNGNASLTVKTGGGGSVLRDVSYFCTGLVLITLSMRFFSLGISYQKLIKRWENGIPKSFGWRIKINNYIKKTFSFIGYLFVWVGAWDYIDTRLVTEDPFRDLLYVVVPIFLSFLLEGLLSTPSLYYLATLPYAHLHPFQQQQRCCGVSCCQPGQRLYPSYDQFLRNVIQPAVENVVSPCQDWAIACFSWVNELFLVTVVQLFLWVGMWDLLSYYLWPNQNETYRDISYVVIGFLGIYISEVFFRLSQHSSASPQTEEDRWYQGLPNDFGFCLKLKHFVRELLSFLGFLFVWVGAWDFLDTKLWEDSLVRNTLYLSIPLFVSFFLEEVLTAESLYFVLVKYRKKKHSKQDGGEGGVGGGAVPFIIQ